ncbi:homeodomain-interacting protein kinase 2-like [Seriola aureovittata]|uniref:homeodomain-interacting protein kinase 2-like n=1 Tax=Seriola aureovittata TaxID=2871759 RepID=UPI0024BDF8DC|nr:homeodomain-interacting protein kinase 2-like [Seriola aureovittata]
MQPIDMWSLGLVAAELALGFPLFPANHEFDMMKFIVDTLGQPPDYLLNCGQRSNHFFKIQGSYNQHTWRLKTPEDFAAFTGHHFRDTRSFRSLDALEKLLYFKNKAEMKEVPHFVDLLKKMLMVDKNGRIIPLEVLEHPFFSVEQHTDSTQNIAITNLTMNMEELNVIQEPSLQRNSIASKDCMTPHEETVFTCPENISAKLEDEEDVEDVTALIQPEVVVNLQTEAVSTVEMKSHEST